MNSLKIKDIYKRKKEIFKTIESLIKKKFKLSDNQMKFLTQKETEYHMVGVVETLELNFKELIETNELTKNLNIDERTKLIDNLKLLLELKNEEQKLIENLDNEFEGNFINLYKLLGKEILLKLFAEVEDIEKLSLMPSSNLKKFSDIFMSHPLVEKAFKDNQRRVIRWLCGRISIAAKMDLNKKPFTFDYYSELENKLNDLQKPRIVKEETPLPIPQLKRKAKRGGKRARNIKKMNKIKNHKIKSTKYKDNQITLENSDDSE